MKTRVIISNIYHFQIDEYSCDKAELKHNKGFNDVYFEFKDNLNINVRDYIHTGNINLKVNRKEFDLVRNVIILNTFNEN